VPPTFSHADLVQGICVVQANLLVEVIIEHIYGHQDKLLQYDELPRLAQLNVQMDARAKAKVHQIDTASMDLAGCQEIQGEGWSVWVQGVKQTADPGPAIRRHIFGEGLWTKLDSKERLPADTFWEVDWDAIGEATNKMPQLFKLWMSKHVSGCFGNGQKMKTWGFWENDMCSCWLLVCNGR